MKFVSLFIQIFSAIVAGGLLVAAYDSSDPGWLATAGLYAMWVLLPFAVLGWASYLAKTLRAKRTFLWGGLATAAAAIAVYIQPMTGWFSVQNGIWFVAVPFAQFIVILALFAYAVQTSRAMPEREQHAS